MRFTLRIDLLVMEGWSSWTIFLQVVVIAGGCGWLVIKVGLQRWGVLLIAGLYWFRHNDVGQLV